MSIHTVLKVVQGLQLLEGLHLLPRAQQLLPLLLPNVALRNGPSTSHASAWPTV